MDGEQKQQEQQREEGLILQLQQQQLQQLLTLSVKGEEASRLLQQRQGEILLLQEQLRNQKALRRRHEQQLQQQQQQQKQLESYCMLLQLPEPSLDALRQIQEAACAQQQQQQQQQQTELLDPDLGFQLLKSSECASRKSASERHCLGAQRETLQRVSPFVSSRPPVRASWQQPCGAALHKQQQQQQQQQQRQQQHQERAPCCSWCMRHRAQMVCGFCCSETLIHYQARLPLLRQHQQMLRLQLEPLLQRQLEGLCGNKEQQQQQHLYLLLQQKRQRVQQLRERRHLQAAQLNRTTEAHARLLAQRQQQRRSLSRLLRVSAELEIGGSTSSSSSRCSSSQCPSFRIQGLLMPPPLRAAAPRGNENSPEDNSSNPAAPVAAAAAVAAAGGSAGAAVLAATYIVSCRLGGKWTSAGAGSPLAAAAATAGAGVAAGRACGAADAAEVRGMLGELVAMGSTLQQLRQQRMQELLQLFGASCLLSSEAATAAKENSREGIFEDVFNFAQGECSAEEAQGDRLKRRQWALACFLLLLQQLAAIVDVALPHQLLLPGMQQDLLLLQQQTSLAAIKRMQQRRMISCRQVQLQLLEMQQQQQEAASLSLRPKRLSAVEGSSSSFSSSSSSSAAKAAAPAAVTAQPSAAAVPSSAACAAAAAAAAAQAAEASISKVSFPTKSRGLHSCGEQVVGSSNNSSSRSSGETHAELQLQQQQQSSLARAQSCGKFVDRVLTIAATASRYQRAKLQGRRSRNSNSSSSSSFAASLRGEAVSRLLHRGQSLVSSILPESVASTASPIGVSRGSGAAHTPDAAAAAAAVAAAVVAAASDDLNAASSLLLPAASSPPKQQEAAASSNTSSSNSNSSSNSSNSSSNALVAVQGGVAEAVEESEESDCVVLELSSRQLQARRRRQQQLLLQQEQRRRQQQLRESLPFFSWSVHRMAAAAASASAAAAAAGQTTGLAAADTESSSSSSNAGSRSAGSSSRSEQTTLRLLHRSLLALQDQQLRGVGMGRHCSSSRAAAAAVAAAAAPSAAPKAAAMRAGGFSWREVSVGKEERQPLLLLQRMQQLNQYTQQQLLRQEHGALVEQQRLQRVTAFLGSNQQAVAPVILDLAEGKCFLLPPLVTAAASQTEALLLLQRNVEQLCVSQGVAPCVSMKGDILGLLASAVNTPEFGRVWPSGATQTYPPEKAVVGGTDAEEWFLVEFEEDLLDASFDPSHPAFIEYSPAALNNSSNSRNRVPDV